MLNKLMQQLKKEFVGEDKVWNPVKDTIYYGRMSDKEIEDMRARNDQSVKQKIRELGSNWLLHPDNKVTRIR